ncbi:MAG: type II secretion system protein [Planctomycetota bacterium]
MIKTKSSGFTLIELLISITVISTVASIAVPILLRSKMVANEAAAICGVQTIATAQETFRRTDWNGDGIFSYAYYISYLYQGYNETAIELIPKSLSLALSFITPDHGYCYREARGYMRGDQWTPCYYDRPSSITIGGNDCWYKILTSYGVTTFPLMYMLTGVNLFAYTNTGVIYQKDASLDIYYQYSSYHNIWEFNGETLYDIAGMALNGWVGVQ